MDLTFSDVNAAYYEMMSHKAKHYASWETTRNGKALAFQEPVLLTHLHPERRVLFDPIRDANPFFHYMEAIWMLAGSEQVAFPSQFASNLKQYSDDGRRFHGAYGWRWRNHWFDQISEVIRMLREDPSTRRAVIAMWDTAMDLGADSKDIPCNTHIYFRYVNGALDMTVCNRSNDLVWGMLGANIVHMSILQEYIANAIGAPIGRLHQFSNNVHIYEGWENRYSETDDRFYNKARTSIAFSPATLNLTEADEFLWEGTKGDYESQILNKNAIPMLCAWNAHKADDSKQALYYAAQIFDDDWRLACERWLSRRYLGE